MNMHDDEGALNTMSKIVGVCLNPCIDRTVEIDAFVYGGMNRIRRARSDGSGKGVNVALAARALGHEAACVGLLNENGGAMVEERLKAAGVDCGFAKAKGEVRTNLKVFDRSSQRITEINESGKVPEEAQLRQLEALVDRYASWADVMVFTGSLPPGLPEEYYARLMAIAGGRCRCVLDAEGKKLLSGLALAPALIKPNSYELELVCGHKLESLEEIERAGRSLLGLGAGLVAVSMGADGAMLIGQEGSWYAPRVPVEVLSTVGAGDSMVVGLLHGLLQGLPLPKVLEMGVAAGTAAVVTEGTQLFDRAGFEAMLPRVHVERLL